MKLCVFATPRSGSSYFARILHQYLVVHENYHPTYLTEIINPRIFFKEHNNEIVIFDYDKTKIFKDIEERELLAAERIELLEKFKSENYLFKVITSQISRIFFDYLNDNYEFLLIERQDKFDQCLSFMLARQTDKWNVFDNDQINFKPIIGEYKHFLEFEWQIEKYKTFKSKMNNIHSIAAYEDLGPNLLKTIGLDKPLKIKENILPNKMLSLEEKMKLFENLDSIKLWFEKSDIDFK